MAQTQHLGQVYGDSASLVALVTDGGAARSWNGYQGDYDAALAAIKNRDVAAFQVARQPAALIACGNAIIDVFRRGKDEVVLVAKIPEDDVDAAAEEKFIAKAAAGAAGKVVEIGPLHIESGVLVVVSAPNPVEGLSLERVRSLSRGAKKLDGGLALPLPAGRYVLWQEKMKDPLAYRLWLVPRGRKVPAAASGAQRGATPAGNATGAAPGSEPRVLHAHDARTSVTCNVEFHPDGTRIAAGGIAGVVSVWSLPGGELLRTERLPVKVKGGFAEVEVHWSPDGRELIARCGGKLWGWEASSFKPLRFAALNKRLTDDTAKEFAVHPDGRIALNNFSVYLSDAKRGKLKALTSESFVISRMAFAPDGRVLITVGQELVTWNADKGTKLGVTALPKHEECHDLAFTPDGKRVIVAANKRFAVFALRARRPESSLSDVSSRRTHHATTTVAVHPHGKWLAGARDDDRSVYLWDLQRRRFARKLPGHLPSHNQMNSHHWFRLAFSPDGRFLAVNAGAKGLGGAVTLHEIGGG